MERTRTQSINLTDPADLLSVPKLDLTIRRSPATVPPGTDPNNYPEMRQVIDEALVRGRTIDATGQVDLRGFGARGKDGERWVVRDQYVKREVSDKLTGPEPIPDFVIRMRGKGWKVLKGMVGMNEDRPGVGINPVDVSDILVETAQRHTQGSLKRVKSGWSRPVKTYAANNRKGGQYKTPILKPDGTPKKTLIPRPYARHDGYGPVLLRAPGTLPPLKERITDTPMLNIDIYDADGNLSRQQNWSREALARYLHDPQNYDPDNPPEFSLTDVLPEKSLDEVAASEQVIERIGGTHLGPDPYMDIVNHLKARGLPDSLVGIAWERGGKYFQVMQDVLVKERVRARTFAEPERVRTFVVRQHDGDGNVIGHKTFRDAELQAYFKDAVTPIKKKGLQNLPKKNFTPLEHIYRRSPVPEAPEAIEPPPQLGGWLRVRALRLLDDSDITDAKHPRKHLAELLADPREASYIPTLEKTVSDIGIEKIKELTEELRDSYLNASELLDLPWPGRKKTGTSWVLKEMLEQRHYADHPDAAGPAEVAKYGLDLTDDTKRFGYYIPDPFEDSVGGVQARRRLLQRSIAAHYVDSALEVALKPKQKKDKHTHKPLFKEGTAEPVVEIKEVYHENEEVTGRLLDIASAGVRHYLNKVVGEDIHKAELDQEDLADMGDLLLRQFPESAVKKKRR